MKNNYQKILLFGPLPPSWGGARVSFKLFHDYLKEKNVDFDHIDVPLRNDANCNPPGKVNHINTFLRVLKGVFTFNSISSVIIFGSRNFCFSYGLLIVLVCKIFNKPCYIRFFGGHPAQSDFFKSKIFYKYGMSFLNMSTKIIVQTHVGAVEFPAKLQKKIAVLPGYRDFTANCRSQKNLGSEIFRFVYVGAINRGKGILYLLDAYSKLYRENNTATNLELHFYGAGKNKLIKKIKHNCKGCVYHGSVKNSKIKHALPGYNVFVFPSLYKSEGHPGVLIEAFCAGLPVIATDLPGPTEIVKHDVNGLIVPSGDSLSLFKAMEKIFNDVALCIRLAHGAAESADNFKAAIVVPKLAQLMNIEI